MEFRTIVDVKKPDFVIGPCEEMLFVGSCFADSIGHRFQEEKFRATVNPFGVMYNPASVLHTIERWEGFCQTAFLTLGTNHVYRLKETGEIVDNCEKRPQSLFTEEELTVDECAGYLEKAVALLRKRNPDVHIVLTVSPIRYRKYGYHGSQLSKATLLLATRQVAGTNYFPAYEIVNDELRDYRFYNADMLHPSEQAIEYIWQQLTTTLFSGAACKFVSEWQPIRQALSHKPFQPDSEEYLRFRQQTQERLAAFQQKYPHAKPGG